jgi:hypothetical protein
MTLQARKVIYLVLSSALPLFTASGQVITGTGSLPPGLPETLCIKQSCPQRSL